MNNNSKMFREFSKIVLEIYHKQLRTINRNFAINNIYQLGSIAATRALRKNKNQSLISNQFSFSNLSSMKYTKYI